MGVDFFPCDRCSEPICDCGDWISCNDDCGRRWCTLCCADQDGYSSPDYDDHGNETSETSCNFCRGEDVEDGDVLGWALKKLKLTRQEAVFKCIRARKKKKRLRNRGKGK